MNVVVVGAGAQGAPCAAVLARQPMVRRVLLASSRLDAADTARRHIGGDKVVAAQVDARDPAALAKLVRERIGEAAVVIDMTPSFHSQAVMRASLALKAHYVNTAACPEHLAQLITGKPLDLAADFKAAGLTAVLGCGASPGAVNVLVRLVCDELDTVDRIEIRAGFFVPAQTDAVKTWMPSWSPEQQYYDYCDPPCLFHDGRHDHMPQFHEPETYDFGGQLGAVQLTHHAHDEQYSLPLTIGKGVRYCCYKYPFEPAVATFFATGFTHDRTVCVNGVDVKPVDVLMALLPRPVQIAVMDREAQKGLVPLVAATRAHVRVTGMVDGKPVERLVRTGAYFDQAAKALELFGSANVAVAYAAATGAVQVAEGRTPAGVLWPEELDPRRFVEVTNSLGLTLEYDLTAVQ